MSTQATRKSYGPFLCTTSAGAVPAEFFSIPWSEVKGANIIVADSDDIDSNPVTAVNMDPLLMVLSEVSIYGVIQGYATPLKCQVVSGKIGPMDLLLPWEEGYERISFRQRIMAGGRPLTPPFSFVGADPALLAASHASVNLSVYVMPRGGFQGVQNG